MAVPKEFVKLRSAMFHELQECETDLELLHSIFLFLDAHCEILEGQLEEKMPQQEIWACLFSANKDIRTLQLAILDYIGNVADSDQLESAMWESTTQATQETSS
jgi:hypothetical protein